MSNSAVKQSNNDSKKKIFKNSSKKNVEILSSAEIARNFEWMHLSKSNG